MRYALMGCVGALVLCSAGYLTYRWGESGGRAAGYSAGWEEGWKASDRVDQRMLESATRAVDMAASEVEDCRGRLVRYRQAETR